MSILETFVIPHAPRLLPEIGGIESLEYEQTMNAILEMSLRISELKPDTVVLISPHGASYGNYFFITSGKRAKGYIGSPETTNTLADYYVRLRPNHFAPVKIEIQLDEEFIFMLEALTKKDSFPAGLEGSKRKNLDVGTIVPLYYLNMFITDYCLVRCSTSRLSAFEHYQFGQYLSQVSSNLNRRTVVIASSDLSHRHDPDSEYGYSNKSTEFDTTVVESLREGNFFKLMTIDGKEREKVGECGINPLLVMAGSLDKKMIKVNIASYQKEFGVGHCVAQCKITGESNSRRFKSKYKNWIKERAKKSKKIENLYARVARFALETYVRTDYEVTKENDLLRSLIQEDKKLATKKALPIFVTLRKGGHLRGSFGRMVPKKELFIDELLDNAVAAGYEDMRFEHVRQHELEEIEYEINVVKERGVLNSIDQLDPREQGVYVYTQKKKKEGIMLPDQNSAITPKSLLGLALKKGKIEPIERYSVEYFTVEKA